ncbi:Ribosome biogenesis protein NOP53 [Golovinomyces cichoracearum]|uniref:Ribosome biogenesis protein NOP53 n=1 Tax=Golovinomyces cichoracearum TaxID=62708 RepID=A0A420IKE3_9PEZI|nr:Ribosome biogenesis protein NOP53 [Golovinomyces cichoracearum]
MPILVRNLVSTNAPQQYSQKSRKGKKAWRKNVDSTDIQNGLEELREELILGGVINERASKDLFAIDTSGDISIQKLALKGSKKLKASEIIAQRSSIPPISMRKRPSEKTTNGIIEPKRQRTSYVSHKEIIRLKAIANGHNKSQTIEIKDTNFDLWDTSRDEKMIPQDPRFSFLEKKKKKVAPVTLKQKPITLAASGKEIPAVIKPSGGYSYNPLASDYIERLEALGEKEVESEKARLVALESERITLEAAAKSAAVAEAAEARVDLSEWEEDSAWEGFESGTEDRKLSSKRPERKTQAQRNRIKRRKEEERKTKMLNDIKKKNEQAAHAKKLAQELDMEKGLRKLQALDSNDSSCDDLELRRRKLGKIRLPEKDLELVLPDDLQESLRLLKPEGNLLKERYRSILVRGKVESRRPISFAKKPKRKVTEKWTHKDFVLH